MKKQNSFFKAGAVLAVSGVVVKAFSAAYRIPLTRMLGADTMGRYSAVFSLFMPFFSFATAGIATSVAHFTAQCKDEDTAEKNKIKTTALTVYLSLAVVLMAVFVLFGRFYAQLQKDSIFFYSSLVLAPAIVFAAAENVLKGTTQGQMDMLPTAGANVLESVFKTTSGLVGVWWVMHNISRGKDDIAVMVCVAAITSAGFVSMIFLLLCCKNRKGGKTVQKEKYSLKAKGTDMLKMSVPIGVSALTISLASFFDTAVCLPKLDTISYSQIAESFSGASFMGAGDMSMYLFGIWQGMVLSVFNLTPAVVSPVTAASLPLISKSWAAKDEKSLVRQSTKLFCITSFLSVPAMMFVFCFGGDIMQLLFDTTPAQAVVAKRLLRIVCCGGIFCCFGAAFNSLMYAAGRADKVFSILLSACVVKGIASFLLCAVPRLNIKAFAVSTAVFYTIIFMRSMAEVKKLGLKFNVKEIFAIPILSSLTALLAVRWLFASQLYSLPLFLRLFFAGAVFGLLYLMVIICTGFLVDK